MITVETYTYTSDRDVQTMTDALGHFGPISMHFPSKAGDPLRVILHPDRATGRMNATQAEFYSAVSVAIQAAPLPIKRESTEAVFRRALVKIARGKALTNDERDSLDRAEGI